MFTQPPITLIECLEKVRFSIYSGLFIIPMTQEDPRELLPRLIKTY